MIEELGCYIVRFEYEDGYRESYCGSYPLAQETNPNSEIITAQWWSSGNTHEPEESADGDAE